MRQKNKPISLLMAGLLLSSLNPVHANDDELSLGALLELDVTESGSFFEFDSRMLPGKTMLPEELPPMRYRR